MGDVELTKAWIGDLATLGHEIPQFNHRPLPTREEENRCAEKVSCWFSPKLFLKQFHPNSSVHYCCISHNFHVCCIFLKHFHQCTSHTFRVIAYKFLKCFHLFILLHISYFPCCCILVSETFSSYSIFHIFHVVAYYQSARCSHRASKPDFGFKILSAAAGTGMIKNFVRMLIFNQILHNGRMQKILVALLSFAFLFAVRWILVFRMCCL